MSSLVKHYGNHQAGAPTLAGTAGYLITLLDACLINGYNTKTITITRSGTTATATCSSHGFTQHSLVLISGADQSDYNGEFYVDTITTDTFTFEVANSPATPATGTISCKVAPAGWTKEYSGTNLAAYRAPTGNRYYLRIDDTPTQYSVTRGYITMSDINTGTEPYPTIAQVADASNGICKSDTANTSARDWRLVVNDKFLYFYNSNPVSQTYTDVFIFGDYIPYNSADIYNSIISIRPARTVSTTYGNAITAVGTAVPGLYQSRIPYSYLTGAANICRYTFGGTSAYIGDMVTWTMPQPYTGKIQFIKIYLGYGGGLIGEYPGTYALKCSTSPIANLSIFTANGDLNGIVFLHLHLNAGSTGGTSGNLNIKIRGTW